jgi:Fe-S-cluster containining protein
MKSIKSICSKCQKCCKKYNITLLLEESERISKKMNLKEEKFIQNYCDLTLQFFPTFNSKNYFVIKKTKLPKKIQEKLKKHSKSKYFFVLPNISLKNNKKCVFLKDGLCEINSVKPGQCKLFPFISLKKETSFWKKYPFCELLKDGFKPEKGFEKKSEKHYKKVKEYFELIKEKGFDSIWKILPEKGNAFFKDEKLCAISQSAFLELTKTFK